MNRKPGSSLLTEATVSGTTTTNGHHAVDRAAERWMAERYRDGWTSPWRLSQGESKTWAAIFIAWHVLVSIFALGLAYAIFATVTTPFETIVVAILAITWVVTRLDLSVLVHRHDDQLMPDSRRYFRILELLNDPEYQSDDAKQRAREGHNRIVGALNRAERTRTIYEVGWAALFLFALYKLIMVVLPTVKGLIHV
jgi:hypothetical protein